eukprot:TRINITY_DN85352_c0_g1_i1.p1 TRINITY_DN85352_c0_g1~~TRINITY_DN85352_c0_g1_i1.p1  ORF type:complete len:294 (-),score=158.56 TRINITY_DN85352_c0_g1_i1:54-935(-)
MSTKQRKKKRRGKVLAAAAPKMKASAVVVDAAAVISTIDSEMKRKKEEQRRHEIEAEARAKQAHAMQHIDHLVGRKRKRAELAIKMTTRKRLMKADGEDAAEALDDDEIDLDAQAREEARKRRELFEAAAAEIEEIGSMNMNKRARKAYEKRKLVEALGGTKYVKSAKVPRKIAMGMAKKNAMRQQRLDERQRAMGLVVRKRKTKEALKKEAEREQDAKHGALVPRIGRFKGGVLSLKSSDLREVHSSGRRDMTSLAKSFGSRSKGKAATSYLSQSRNHAQKQRRRKIANRKR